MRSLGEWMFDSLSANPVRTVATPRAASSETSGIAPPERIEERPHAEHLLEGVEPELHGGRVGRHEPGRRLRPDLDLHLGALRRRLAEQPLEGRDDDGRILVADEPDRDVRLGLDRDHRLLQGRRAALDAVHVDGRLGPGADVELLGRLRVGRTRPGRGDLGRPGRELLPALELGRRRGTMPSRSGSGTRPSRGSTPESVCISACIALSEAPPYMPECRSRDAGA